MKKVLLAVRNFMYCVIIGAGIGFGLRTAESAYYEYKRERDMERSRIEAEQDAARIRACLIEKAQANHGRVNLEDCI